VPAAVGLAEPLIAGESFLGRLYLAQFALAPGGVRIFTHLSAKQRDWRGTFRRRLRSLDAAIHHDSAHPRAFRFSRLRPLASHARARAARAAMGRAGAVPARLGVCVSVVPHARPPHPPRRSPLRKIFGPDYAAYMPRTSRLPRPLIAVVFVYVAAPFRAARFSIWPSRLRRGGCGPRRGHRPPRHQASQQFCHGARPPKILDFGLAKVTHTRCLRQAG
jgi:hypothetical protein